MKYSFIIPVYNRPREIDELLESMTRLTTTLPFEVVLVEDGSEITCKEIIDKYNKQLKISYYYKENSGPGDTRNYGMQKAQGDYFIILDSDCLVPSHYLDAVDESLQSDPADCFGGPDAAHDSFSNIQKAISYSMTSLFTTGGIRGKSEKFDQFYPRSFNMGFSKKVFKSTKGFSKMRFGEDIDISIRIIQNGYKIKLIKSAFVFHKRRTTLGQFFKQVFNSGIARINLYKRHPDSLKIIHFAPTLFTIGFIILLILSITISAIFFLPILIYSLIILIDSSFKNKNIYIGLISVVTSFTQLLGYGFGFINAAWKRIILNKGEFSAYKNTFYK